LVKRGERERQHEPEDDHPEDDTAHGAPQPSFQIGGSLAPSSGYFAVPPTVMRSMRSVGWPTPTGTP
jgi:hypothetical protein